VESVCSLPSLPSDSSSTRRTSGGRVMEGCCADERFVAGDASDVEWGTNKLVEWHAGDAPLVVSVPHDGTVVPPGAQIRRGPGVVVEPDHYTMALAYDLQEAFHQLTGRRLHLIIARISRSCVDMNR